MADSEFSLEGCEPKQSSGFLEQGQDFHVGFGGGRRIFFINFLSRDRIFIMVIEADQCPLGASAPGYN